MENLEQYYQLIEGAIKELGVDPEQCRDDKEGGAWALIKGQQEIWLDCWYIENEQRVYFQALAPVLEVPNDMAAPFYRDILEVNYNLFGAGFGIFKNMLAIKSIREVEGMDQNECIAIITRVGNYASDYTPALVEKYFNKDPNAAPNTDV